MSTEDKILLATFPMSVKFSSQYVSGLTEQQLDELMRMDCKSHALFDLHRGIPVSISFGNELYALVFMEEAIKATTLSEDRRCNPMLTFHLKSSSSDLVEVEMKIPRFRSDNNDIIIDRKSVADCEQFINRCDQFIFEDRDCVFLFDGGNLRSDD